MFFFKGLIFLLLLLGQSCLGSSASFQEINGILGIPDDESSNATILGTLNSIQTKLGDETSLSVYKKKLAGSAVRGRATAKMPPSIFTKIIEFKDLFEKYTDSLSSSSLQNIETLVGTISDSNPSLYNCVHLLDDMIFSGSLEDIDTFETTIGIINKLKKEVWLPNLVGAENSEKEEGLLGYLNTNTVFNIIENPSLKYSYIKQDLLDKLNGSSENSLKNQLENLRQVFFESTAKKKYVRLIGNFQSEDQYCLLSRFEVLENALENAEESAIDFLFFYEKLFALNGLSLQSKIYEIYSKLLLEEEILSDIGSILREDYSLFGSINKCIYEQEVKKIIDLIGKQDSELSSSECIQKILKEMIGNFSFSESKVFEVTLGEKPEPKNIFIEGLVDGLDFLYETIKAIYPIISNSAIAELRTYLLECWNLTKNCENASLEVKIQKVGTLSDEYSNEHSDNTIWGTVNKSFKEICEIFCNLLTKNINGNSVVKKISELEYLFEDGVYSSDYFGSVNFIEDKLKEIEVFFDFLFSEKKIKISFKEIAFDIFKDNFESTTGAFLNEGSSDLIPGFFEFIESLKEKSDIKNIFPAIQNRVLNLRNIVFSQQLIGLLEGDKNSVKELLVEIATFLQDYSALSECIGNLESSYDEISIKSPTIFSLLSKITIMLSEGYSINSSNFVLFAEEVGNVYSGSITSESKTLYSVVQDIHEKILFAEAIDEVIISELSQAIGGAADSPGVSASSLFSILYSLLLNLLEPYSIAMLLPSEKEEENQKKYDFGIYDGLVEIINLLEKDKNNIEENAELINQIGDEANNGILKRLLRCYSMKDIMPSNLEFFRNFLFYLAEAKDIVNKFIADFESEKKFDYLEKLERCIDNILAIENCNGCIELADFISKLNRKIRYSTDNLKMIHDNELPFFLQNNNFEETAVCIEEFIRDFCNAVAKRKIYSGECFWGSLNFSTSILENDSERLYEEFQKLFSSIGGEFKESAEYVIFKNRGCGSLQEIIDELASDVNLLAVYVRTPTTFLSEYNEVNEKSFEKIYKSILDFIITIEEISGKKFCENCLFQNLSLGLLKESFLNLQERIFLVQEFFKSALYSKIASKFYKIASSLYEIEFYVDNSFPMLITSNYSIYEKNLFSLSILSVDLKNIAEGFDTILKNQENTNLFYENLDYTIKNIQESCLSFKNISNILSLGYDFNFIRFEEPKNYNKETLNQLIYKIQTSLQSINIFWNSMKQSLVYCVEETNFSHKRTIYIFEDIASFNNSINNSIQNFQNLEILGFPDYYENLKLTFAGCDQTTQEIFGFLKENCARSFFEKLEKLSCIEMAICRKLSYIPTSELFKNANFYENLMPYLAEQSQAFFELLYSVYNTFTQNIAQNEKGCFHFYSPEEALNTLLDMEKSKFLAFNSLGESMEIESSEIEELPEKVDISVTLDTIKDAGFIFNEWFDSLSSAACVVEKCNKNFSKKMLAQKDSYNAISEVFGSLKDIKFCERKEIGSSFFEDFCEIFRLRSKHLEKIIDNIHSSLNCKEEMLEDFCSINCSIENLGRIISLIPVNSGFLGTQEQQLLKTKILYFFNEIKQQVKNFDVFFSNANNDSCILDAAYSVSAVKNLLEEMVNYFISAFKINFSSSEVKELEMNDLFAVIGKSIEVLSKNIFELTKTISEQNGFEFYDLLEAVYKDIEDIIYTLRSISSRSIEANKVIFCAYELEEFAKNLDKITEILILVKLYIESVVNKNNEKIYVSLREQEFDKANKSLTLSGVSLGNWISQKITENQKLNPRLRNWHMKILGNPHLLQPAFGNLYCEFGLQILEEK